MSNTQAGALAARFSLDITNFLANAQQAGNVGEAELARIQRQAKIVTDYIKAMGAAQKQVADAADLKRVSTQAENIARAAQISVGQATAALRSVPAQMTDIATQLAGGQNPLLILLQQGGQMKDQFGGMRGLFAALASGVSVASVAMAAAAVAAGAVAYSYYAAGQEAKRLTNLQTLTGNAVGLTASRLSSYAATVAQ